MGVALLYNKCMVKTFATGPAHTFMIPITAQIESGYVTEDDLIPFGYGAISLSTTSHQMDGINSSILNGCPVSIRSSARSLGLYGLT
ncbi:hypothetical protein TNCV_2130681 [Trichonephila clavipes]|nr:hypothetical protein TNCV_2130681 [Trichonephila clavipes]